MNCGIANCGIANCGIANCSMQWTSVKIAVADGIVELRTSSSGLRKNSGPALADYFLKVAKRKLSF